LDGGFDSQHGIFYLCFIPQGFFVPTVTVYLVVLDAIQGKVLQTLTPFPTYVYPDTMTYNPLDGCFYFFASNYTGTETPNVALMKMDIQRNFQLSVLLQMDSNYPTPLNMLTLDTDNQILYTEMAAQIGPVWQEGLLGISLVSDEVVVNVTTFNEFSQKALTGLVYMNSVSGF